MPRTRSVYPADELAHKWAHGGQNLRAQSRSNVFCDDDTIFSYGRHFPMAKRLVRRRGKFIIPPPLIVDGRTDTVVFLVNPRFYSNTTSKHQSYVNRAIHNVGTHFRVDPSLWPPLISRDGKSVAAYFQDHITNRLLPGFLAAKRKITKANLLASAQSLAANHQELRKFFRLPSGTVRVPKVMLDFLPQVDAILKAHEASVAAAASTRHANDRIRWAERDAEREKRRARNAYILTQVNAADKSLLIAAWRSGRNPTIPVDFGDGSPILDYQIPLHHLAPHALLRLDPTKKERVVETSLGARLPLTAFKVALAHLRTLPPGAYPDFQVSDYRGLTLNGTSLRIGCHTILYTELNAFLSTLSLPPYEPAHAQT